MRTAVAACLSLDERDCDVTSVRVAHPPSPPPRPPPLPGSPPLPPEVPPGFPSSPPLFRDGSTLYYGGDCICADGCLLSQWPSTRRSGRASRGT